MPESKPKPKKTPNTQTSTGLGYVLSLLLCRSCMPSALAAEVQVFAAASLTEAMETLAERYEATTGVQIRLSLAGSSTLARQIEAGAGAEVLLSADEAWIDYLVERQRVQAASRVDLLGNALVLVTPRSDQRDWPLSAPFAWAPLLGQGRLAVGDPSHVPAGRYAEQALRSLGYWSALAERLAPAESVRAALVLVERGEAPAGIVYRTDAAISPGLRVAAEFPPSSHQPIRYPLVLVAAQPRPEARAFYQFLQSPAAAEVFVRLGFSWLLP